MEAVDPACVWEVGEVVSVYDSRLTLDGCEIPAGVTITAQVIEVDPIVVRVLFTEHPSCDGDRQALRDLRRQADKQAHALWGTEYVAETVRASCLPAARVDVKVTETR